MSTDTTLADQKTTSVSGPAAPTADVELAPRMARRLATRTPLELDSARPFAIKRNVHELVVDAEPGALAAALREVVADPVGRFGLIRIKRRAERVGRPFEAGERLHGCVALEGGLRAWLGRGRVRRSVLRPIAASAFALPGARRAARWLEDRFLSDYAEVVEIAETRDAAGREVHRLVYRYLDGSPIAGRSVLTIEPAGDRQGGGGSRVTVVFEYQEVSGAALGALHRFGIQRHDQVVHEQVARAAARAGARILASTIQPAYAAL